MNYTEHDIELAERYVDGELTAEQKKAVEERMKGDETFRMLINEEMALTKGVRYNGLRKDLEFLKDFEATLPNAKVDPGTTRSDGEKPKGKSVFFTTYRAPLAAAASVLLIVVAYFGLMRPASTDELYAEYFHVFDSPGSGLTRGDNNVMSNKAKAYQAYDLGDYAKAITFFELEVKDNHDAIAHLCLGNAYLATGDAVRAEEALSHIIKEHDGDLNTPAKWYLALTYLKQGKMERVNSILWEISDSSTYGEDAKKLLKELN